MFFRHGWANVFTLRVGYACNNRCVHCFVEDKRDDTNNLSFDQITQVIDLMDKEEGIVITGGEPTMRDDLLEICKYVKRKNPKYTINFQTNGIKFSDPDYLHQFEPYLKSIVLPIHSCDFDIFDAITQNPGSGKQVEQAFKNLNKTKIKVQTQTVINQLNYKTIPETFEWIKKMDRLSTSSLTYPHPVGAAFSTAITPRYRDTGPYILNTIKKFPNRIHTHYIPLCYLHPYEKKLLANVDESDFGTVMKDGIDFIDNSWKRTNYGMLVQGSKVKSPNCVNCKLHNKCIGVWREYGRLYPDLENDLIPII